MKLSRNAIIWLTLAVCGLLVIGTMLWLTRGVLESERTRAGAEARADLEARTRLALWRLDAAGAALLLDASQRPLDEFQDEAAALPHPSQFNRWVKLRFEVQDGRLTAPATGESPARLKVLEQLLARNGDLSTQFSTVMEASEMAWQAMPKSNGELPPERSQNPEPGSLAANSAYQENANRIEKAQRAKVVQGQQASAQSLNQAIVNGFKPPAAMADLFEIGPMRAVAIGGELFFLRRLTAQAPANLPAVIQGVWLDDKAVRTGLLESVTDLVAGATLEMTGACTPGCASCPASLIKADDPLALVSLPYRLQRGPQPLVPAPPWSKPLWIGWVAVLLALATVTLLVAGIMNLSERRASFVSAVTHELRTPLTTFRLYADLLGCQALSEIKRQQYLGVLAREADRLSHLVENVLAFSRIERGTARSNRQELTVAELLEKSRERLEARLASAGLTLVVVGAGTERVRVDTAAVDHILFNLVDNAAKYAAASVPPVVEISSEAAGREVRITVRDHGPGVAPSECQRIFRAFHKSAHEAAESQPGVGLGLALSRRLAQAAGGSLECVASARGAAFTLSLPRIV